MDQKLISGIGNIYASEILHLCKINPLKDQKKSQKRDEEISFFFKICIKNAIKKGGSSIRDFVHISGNW